MTVHPVTGNDHNSFAVSHKFRAAEAAEIVGTTPGEFDATMKREVARWTQVVKAAGIKIE